MTGLTRAKLGFAVVGVVIFAAGLRYDNARLRTVAIGFVAIAWLLRFVRGKPGIAEAGSDQGDER